jgi:spermidine synthase
MIVKNFDDLLNILNTKKPFIYQSKDSTSLQFSIAAVQSEMWPDSPIELVLGYTRSMMGFLLFNAEPKKIGMVGLGGGSLPKYCFTHLPQSSIVVIENNPEVIALRNHFCIPPDSARFEVVCADGADYVKGKSGQFDVLILDGFEAHGQPGQLCTQAFYNDCFEMLTPEGILVVNFLEPDIRNVQRIERISESFDGEVVIVDAQDSLNKIVFAFKGSDLYLPDHVINSRLRALKLDHDAGLAMTAHDILLQRRIRKFHPNVQKSVQREVS